jgi:hypothetical protein
VAEDNGNGKWAQIVVSIVLSFLTLAQVGVLWILADIKTDFRGNKQEFYSKLDRVVEFYQNDSTKLVALINKVCGRVDDLANNVKEHDTLLKFDYPRRKEYFINNKK